MSATTYKWDSYPVAHFPVLNSGTYFHNGTRQLVPRNMRQFNIRVVPHPPMPVTAAQAGSFYFYNYTVSRNCRCRNVSYFYISLKFFKINCFHIIKFSKNEFSKNDKHNYALMVIKHPVYFAQNTNDYFMLKKIHHLSLYLSLSSVNSRKTFALQMRGADLARDVG